MGGSPFQGQARRCHSSITWCNRAGWPLTACRSGGEAFEEVQSGEAEDDLAKEFARIRAQQDELEALPKSDQKKCTNLQQDIIELRALVEERRGAHERLKAEVDNFRERTRQELYAAQTLAAIPIIDELLPIADEFDLARKSLQPETEAERRLVDGFEALLERVLASWAAVGVRRLQAEGEPFDPELHEAVTMAASTEYKEQVVCSELRAGWVLRPPGARDEEKAKVLRPALVVVSAGPGPPS